MATNKGNTAQEAETHLLSLRDRDLSGRAIRRSILPGFLGWLEIALKTIPVINHFNFPERWKIGRADFLENEYNWFFNRASLPKATGGVPRLHIMTTGFAVGEPHVFSDQEYVYPHCGQTVNAAELPIATAVAASSAFPPVFGPIEVTNGTLGLPSPPFKHGLHDGGVYDNTGLEQVTTVEKTNRLKADLIILSDAGKQFKGDWPHHPSQFSVVFR